MKKNQCIITAAVTTVAVFILTTLFYNTLYGRYIYSKINSILGNSDFSKFVIMETLIEENYMGESNKAKMMDYAAVGYAEALGDQYTEYLDRESYKSMNESLSGEYKGIGVKISINSEKIYIYYVEEDGPADKAGIQKGDYIIAVDGKKYGKDDVAEAISDIKDTPKGKIVVITVEREGQQKDIEVMCGNVDLKYVKSRMIDESVGYIKVQQFGNSVDKKFEESIENLKKQNMKSLIIDLRSNPGGSLDVVVNMCDLLLPECVITTIKDKNGNEEVYKSDSESIDIPICVLVNGQSASASEVMSGALKDHKRAVLIGEKTYGKGVVQGIYPLGDGSALKLTVSKYYTPSGECINEKGIDPDITVTLPDGVDYNKIEENPENDTQLKAAIEELKNK